MDHLEVVKLMESHGGRVWEDSQVIDDSTDRYDTPLPPFQGQNLDPLPSGLTPASLILLPGPCLSPLPPLSACPG